jgi:hypothetical protein
LAKTAINGVSFHVEAIQVEQDTGHAQNAVAESYRERIAALKGAEERAFTTMHLHGREYVIVITPHLHGDLPLD